MRRRALVNARAAIHTSNWPADRFSGAREGRTRVLSLSLVYMSAASLGGGTKGGSSLIHRAVAPADREPSPHSIYSPLISLQALDEACASRMCVCVCYIDAKRGGIELSILYSRQIVVLTICPKICKHGIVEFDAGCLM